MRCPCCESTRFHEVVSRQTIAWETSLRTSFINNPVSGISRNYDDKDRTSFAHDRTVGLSECLDCGLLVRNDRDDDFLGIYEQDQYDPVVLDHFRSRDIRYFSSRKEKYKPLLPEAADVLEVGSYAGGFLEVAARWGWNISGIDVGNDVVRYNRDQGYQVQKTSLEEARLENDCLDAVFIWNCFDQLPEPGVTLQECFRILKPEGLLVIRVPNALFYRICQPILYYVHQTEPGPVVEKTITRVMGFNNLLGFPYQFGYSPANLRLMVATYGFIEYDLLPSNLLLLPYEEASPEALMEQRAIIRLLDELASIASTVRLHAPISPWMELILVKPKNISDGQDRQSERIV